MGMQRFWLPLFVAICGFAAQPTVYWLGYRTALEQSAKTNMLVFVSIFAEGCVPCKQMESEAFRDSAVTSLLNQKFLSTHLDAMSDSIISCNNWPRPVSKCITENWKLQGVPSFLLLGPSGNVLVRFTGYQNASQMKLILEEFLQSRSFLLETDRKSKEHHVDP